MNLIKIGKFIADRRKLMKLTQSQLAEKLNITDRAVSKWETGKSLPDASIMLELCSILKITVNDLLSGEVINMKDYNKEMENKLIEMVKQKEEADKRLLKLECVIGILAIIVMIVPIIIASVIPMGEPSRAILCFIGFPPFLVACFAALRIEQVAGYYECKHCHHRYVPTYNNLTMAMHIGRTRYMKCPECGKKSWQKKVISKETD